MRKCCLWILALSSFAVGEQCQITSPLPVPVLLSGCTYAGSPANALAAVIGSTVSWKTQISSPTTAIVVDQSQFNGLALGIGATAYYSIAYSTNAQTTNYTAVATDTVIMANCGSACTVTLPIPTFSGKVYMVVQAGLANVTVSPSVGQIDGGSTALMNQQYSELDVLWDGSNWWVK